MLDSAFEDVEVYIANIAVDDFGRRTKDSVIAQNIYTNLEQKNIKTFSKRFSTGVAIGNDAETICNVAAKNAPIILFVATNKTNFDVLYEEFSTILKDKIVIPVYSDMDAHDIPSEISHLQALHYNALGSQVDLVKNILKLLHRETEVSYEQLTEVARKNKKKIHITISILCGIILILGLTVVAIYGYSIMPSKKFDVAQELIEQENYADAIIILNEIKEYKHSDSLLKSVYQKYNGYYQDKNNNVSMHLSISDNSNAMIEISRILLNGNIVKVIENAVLSNNEIKFTFTDSQNNSGQASLVMKNNGIILKCEVDKNISDDNIGDLEVLFDLKNKSDAPILEKITKETLLEWISNRITESEIKAKGYELEYLHPLKDATYDSVFKIKNTDIELLLCSYDPLSGNFDSALNDRVICAVFAPAMIVIQDKVGVEQVPFKDGNTLYFPGCRFGQYGLRLVLMGMDNTDIIEDDTIVAITATNLTNVEHLLGEIVINKVMNYIGNDDGIGRIEAVNDGYFLVSVYERYDSTTALLYSVNKNTESVEFISEVPRNNNEILWHNYPNLFEEFIGFEDNGSYNAFY